MGGLDKQGLYMGIGADEYCGVAASGVSVVAAPFFEAVVWPTSRALYNTTFERRMAAGEV